jgi:hypothetical protein
MGQWIRMVSSLELLRSGLDQGEARSTKSSDRVPRTEPEVLPEKRGIIGTGMVTSSPGTPEQWKRF